MTSKEALKRLLKYVNINEADLITKYGYSASNDIEPIKKDLKRLETFDYIATQNVELREENTKLKKAIKILKKLKQKKN